MGSTRTNPRFIAAQVVVPRAELALPCCLHRMRCSDVGCCSLLLLPPPLASSSPVLMFCPDCLCRPDARPVAPERLYSSLLSLMGQELRR